MSVMYMDRDSIDALSPEDIRDLINEKFTRTKYERLEKYYQGEHDILNRERTDSTAPNNRIVHNMPRYITSTATGYFLGKPIIYNSDNEELMDKIAKIFESNDEQDHNMELAKKESIDGECYEMLWLDEECNIRFAKVNPENVLLIFETEAPYTSPLAAIRRYISMDKDKNIITRCEYWTPYKVLYFKSFNGGYYELIDIKNHYWNDVPFVLYINNEELKGDWEDIISEVDAYNKVQSNTANIFEYNDDALLKITGMGSINAEDVTELKEDGAVVLEEGGDIDWLIKSMNDVALENHKKRLIDDMHKITFVPNLNDEAFGGNLSGIAMSYKLWGLEQITGIKERKFKRSLQRRLKLICNILKVFGQDYDYKDISMKFRRNMPQNIVEIADVITKLSGELSRETKLEMLPFIENVKDELKRIADEQNMELEDFGTYQNLAKAFAIKDDEVLADVEGDPDE